MKSILKKLLLWWTILLTSFFFIFPSVEVYASSTATTSNSAKSTDKWSKEKNFSETVKTYQNMEHSLYAITWPLVIIAGEFMSNEVIYGKFVWMDVILWKIWNVMRTFANYIIWLILIFSIFTLFLWWKFEQFNPVKIIPKLVISAFLVNASWFILWACLDISNILTYSIWTLPLNISSTDIDKKVIPTFGIEFQNDKTPVKIWVRKWKELLPFCEMTETDKWWLKVMFPKNFTWSTSECAFEYGNRYWAVWKNGIEIPKWEVKVDKNGEPILPGATQIKAQTFWQLKRKHPWMSTILWTLYASILNVWNLWTIQTWTSKWVSMNILFKVLFLFALIIPLFTFAIIMIARALVLWMFIIISPIVFLFTSIKWIWDKLLWEKWTLKEMCCMVFLPVTVTFALSISFIFLTAINFKTVEKNFGIWWKWNEVYLETDGNPAHRIHIKIKDVWKDSAIADMVWLLQNTILWVIKLMFAIWFMWILVFTALKSCKITWWIAIAIEWFSRRMAKATPILPVAGWQSITSLSQWLQSLSQLPWRKQQEQYQELEKLFTHKDEKELKEESKQVSSDIKKVDTDFWAWAWNHKITTNNNKEIALNNADIKNNTKAIAQAIATKYWVNAGKMEEILQKIPSGTVSKNKKIIEEWIKKLKVKKILEKAAKNGIEIKKLDNDFKKEVVEILNSDKTLTLAYKLKDDLFDNLTDTSTPSKKQVHTYLKKVFGLLDEDIKKLLGEKP